MVPPITSKVITCNNEMRKKLSEVQPACSCRVPSRPLPSGRQACTAPRHATPQKIERVFVYRIGWRGASHCFLKRPSQVVSVASLGTLSITSRGLRLAHLDLWLAAYVDVGEVSSSPRRCHSIPTISSFDEQLFSPSVVTGVATVTDSQPLDFL